MVKQKITINRKKKIDISSLKRKNFQPKEFIVSRIARINNIDNKLSEILDIGTNTLSTLSSQREILLNTEKKLDKISENLNITDKIVTRMNSFYKRISYAFSKNPIPIENSENSRIKLSPMEVITNEVEKADLSDNESEQLDYILKNAKSLKKISEIINIELKLHNVILDSIDEKTENSTIKLNNVNKKINKLL